MTREALAVGLWRTRLALTRNRCLYVAESSLAAAERLQHIRRACQQKDARIYRRTADARWASMAFSVRRMASPSGARVLNAHRRSQRRGDNARSAGRQLSQDLIRHRRAEPDNQLGSCSGGHRPALRCAFMITALIAAVATVIAAIIAVVGQMISNRNDRALAHQEVDLLKKLSPDSDAATHLEMVIERRIGQWRDKSEPYRVAQARGNRSLVFALAAIYLVLPLSLYLDPQLRDQPLPSELTRLLAYSLLIVSAAFLANAFQQVMESRRLDPEHTKRSRRKSHRDHTASPDISLAKGRARLSETQAITLGRRGSQQPANGLPGDECSVSTPRLGMLAHRQWCG